MAIDRDPFTYERDGSEAQATEFSFGRGMFPDPRIDFDPDGTRSAIPKNYRTRRDQALEMLSIRRMDINDPAAQPDPYVKGNLDRYGAQPPVVREVQRPRAEPRPRYARPRMERGW